MTRRYLCTFFSLIALTPFASATESDAVIFGTLVQLYGQGQIDDEQIDGFFGPRLTDDDVDSIRSKLRVAAFAMRASAAKAKALCNPDGSPVEGDPAAMVAEADSKERGRFDAVYSSSLSRLSDEEAEAIGAWIDSYRPAVQFLWLEDLGDPSTALTTHCELAQRR